MAKNVIQQLSELTDALKEKEERNVELDEALSFMEAAEGNERYLKNEAFGFILSEGLLEKFLEFREEYHRTPTQRTHYTLVLRANLAGFWLDMDIV